jgi:hypothetical protein
MTRAEFTFADDPAALWPRDWWTDHNELASLVTWLDETYGVTLSDVRDLLDAPWHFQVEFDAMCSEQREADAA